MKTRIKMEKMDKMKKAISFLFLLLIIVRLSFSVGDACTWDKDCPYGEICGGEDKCIPCRTSAECVKATFEKSVPALGELSPWFIVSLVVVGIAAVTTALIFMIGYAFNIERVKQIAKAELAQTAASLLLVALLFGTEWFEQTLIGMMEKQTGIITAAVYSPQEFRARTMARQTMMINPFDVSLAFLRKLGACLENQYKKIYEGSNNYEFLGNIQFQLETKFPLINALQTAAKPMLLTGVAEKVAEAEYMADQLVWLSIFVYAQIAIMRFAETSMFTIFLPIGIILRAFPPTRGAGAVMIAIAIGLYIVYPFTYTVLVTSAPKNIEGCDLTIPVARSEVSKTCPIQPGALGGAIEQAQAAAATFDIEFPRIKSGASSIFYLSWIFMLISLGVSFLFMRAISPLLGADISEIGRSMFKML